MSISYAFVIVKLVTHSAKGVTERDFALAKKIEEVLLWDAAAEPNGVFEGTPKDDQRFSYIKG
jgi:4a-hydroxytetrahydrobiopterin dehydratase